MTQYGSMTNYLSDRPAGFEPEVGMGATILMWSDRRPATIVEVIRFKTGAQAGQVKAVVIQEDDATRIDSNGMSDAQSYTYEPQPAAAKETFPKRKDGRFASSGVSLRIGSREKYYDYSF